LYVSQNNYSSDQIKEDEITGHVARMVGRRNAYTILVGKPERKMPLARPRRRWKDNVRIDL
jgi:hypothetical protein